MLVSTRNDQNSNRVALWVAVGCILISLLPLAVLTHAGDERQGTLAVIFAPTIRADRAFAAVVDAGGRPIRQGWSANFMIAADNSVGFAGRLRAQGAWLVIDPGALINFGLG